MLTGCGSMKNSDPGRQKAWIRDLALFSVIVSDILAYTGAGIGVGYFAWKKLGAPGWVIAVTSTAGLAMAFFRIYKMSKRTNEETDRKS